MRSNANVTSAEACEASVLNDGLGGTNWADGLPAFIADTVFDVRLKDGQQRQCQRAFGFGESNLYFTDCTHPMQNAYCADSLIDAWRVSPNAEITGLAPGKENDK